MKSEKRRLAVEAVLNVLLSVCNLIALLWLTRVATIFLVPASFALFGLLRRYAATASSFVHLGGPFVQIRYAGIHHDDRPMVQLITLNIFALFSCASLLLVGVSSIYHDSLLSALQVGSTESSWLVKLLLFLIVQQLFGFIVINVLLIERRIILMNLFSILSNAGLYLLLFLLFELNDLERLIWLFITCNGVLLFLGHCYATLPAILNWRALPWHRTKEVWNEIFSYGLPRGFISTFDNMLFLTVPWMLRDEPLAVAALLILFSVIQASSILVLPVNQLSMVVASRELAGASSERRFKKAVPLMLFGLVTLSIVLCAFAYPLLDILLALIVSNEEILAALPQYYPLLLCIIPLTIFNGLKGVIEVYWKFPVNLVNLVLANALAACAILWFGASLTVPQLVVLAISLSFWSLGISTLFALRAFMKDIRTLQYLTLLGLMMPAALLLKDRVTSETVTLLQAILPGIVSTATLCALFAFWFFISGKREFFRLWSEPGTIAEKASPNIS